MKRQIEDISDTASDIPAIEALISEREELRIQKDWEAADTIRNKLKETHGVKIFDEERIWRGNDGNVGAIIRTRGPSEGDQGAKPSRLLDSQVCFRDSC